MAASESPLKIEIVTDPEELARADAQRARFDRNWAWFQAHAQEIFQNYRGKHLCVAGQQLFAADTPQEAIAAAKAAHPEDDGRFVHYVYRERMARIYGNLRWVEPRR